ncbi:MAG: nitronate monooxygenase [Phycisphaerales bacterium]|nr:nitronate monooxygenase [Phycisphaerales bacterium]
MKNDRTPIIIQGGMGAGVSGWPLARAVAKAGQLGVVSGTALDVILARRLQAGDPGWHMRRALESFPVPGVGQRILDRYFVEGGNAADKPFKAKPLTSEKPSRHLEELIVVSNYAEVFLAKEGHDGSVGINYLEKIQLPTLPSLFGAMLAGVSYILMGAGIPKAIPGIMDQLARGESVELRLDVKDADRDEVFTTTFDPATFCGGQAPRLDRPDFLAIVSSQTLASMLARKASGKVNGFIVEGPTAGGHNAPPRGPMLLSREGEPIYGERDVADLDAFRALGLPFWVAGSYAEPERIAEALRLGAAGVQLGTAFAFCSESGLDTEIRDSTLAMSLAGHASVYTDPVASPTGFPFKVLQMSGTHSEAATYEQRTRICDLGYLRHAYKKPDGTLGWRCPSEPIEDYIRKGGDEADTRGRKCVCNGLMANIGLAQLQKTGREKPLITSGDGVSQIGKFLKPGAERYSAADVIDYLLADKTEPHAATPIHTAATRASS